MIALVHSELLKLRTLRSTAWAAAALLAITLLTAGLALGEAGEENMTTPRELRETVLAIGYAAVFFLAVMGAIAAAGEYRHRTISQRFLASPARYRVLLAKLTAYAVVGAGAAVAVTAVASVLGQAVVSSKGYTLDLAAGGARMAAGIAVATMLAGMLGVVVGSITRNPTTAMVAVFGVWMFEKIAGGWFGEVAQYFPFALIENVLGLTDPMAWGYAVLALAGLTAALALVAQRVFVPRDVT
jgi:ABC-2 type transport system permease protein